MNHQTLDVTILPNGSLLLEFVDTAEHFDESSIQVQHDIFRLYNTEPETWLLLLGFRDRQIGLSAALEYWRDFAGRFVVKLSQVEGLE